MTKICGFWKHTCKPEDLNPPADWYPCFSQRGFHFRGRQARSIVLDHDPPEVWTNLKPQEPVDPMGIRNPLEIGILQRPE